MRILSFDVGIKNLAYCYFETQCQTIIDWAVVDLCDDKRMCSGLGCNKTATYTKNDDYFCNKHTKEFVKMNPQYCIPNEKICCDMMTDLSSTKLKKLAIGLGAIQSNTKMTVDILRDTLCDFIDTNLMESVMTRNAKNVDLIEIGRNMDTYFSRLFCDDGGLLRPEIVIIENQISPIANRMKTIQGMIAQFFITHFRGIDIPVKFISSSNKLKDYIDSSMHSGGHQSTTTYDERKKKGIVVCRELISSHNSNRDRWLEKFEKHSKKDDLADSLLQGLWYSRHILKENVMTSTKTETDV